MKAFLVTVTGRVQGVGFRWFIMDKAQELGICGWVKNCFDGSVKIYCEGTEEKLEQFLLYCAQGPPYSRVQTMEKNTETPKGSKDFRVTY